MELNSSGDLAFEILCYKVLNRIMSDHDTHIHLEVAPPSDDDVDILGSMLLHGHVGCYHPTVFFYAALKLLFPSFNLENRVTRKLEKLKDSSVIDWQTTPKAGSVSNVCCDFYKILFGKWPQCHHCNESEHFTQLRRFLLALKEEKKKNEGMSKTLDTYLLKLDAYENLRKHKLKTGIKKLHRLCNWFKSQGKEQISVFYGALARRYQALASNSSQKAREYLLDESSLLKKVGLQVESSRALADYFGLLAEVEPNAYRCAIYNFYAYALRRREVFGCSAYRKDLFEYYKHMMCHYFLLNDNKRAIEHACKAEQLAEGFDLKAELENVKFLLNILTRKDENKSLSGKRMEGEQVPISESYPGESREVALLYYALRTPDFTRKAEAFQKISEHLSKSGETEIARYYSFLAELYDSIPLSKTYRDHDVLKLKKIVARYRFDDLKGAEIHKQLIMILLQLAEKSSSMSEKDLNQIKEDLSVIEDECRVLFNDEMMVNVTETTSAIISELEKYVSLSRSNAIKIADVSSKLIKVYEERVPGLLKYMDYPELVELLSETIPMFKKFLSDLTSPISALKLQGKISYVKGRTSEEKVLSAIKKGLVRKIPSLIDYELVNAVLRDRKGAREKDLVLNLTSEDEEAIAIFTIKDHKRPTGIGLVDEFKTIIDEEKSQTNKKIFGFFVAQAFSKNAIERCKEYGIVHYTISEILALAEE